MQFLHSKHFGTILFVLNICFVFGASESNNFGNTTVTVPDWSEDEDFCNSKELLRKNILIKIVDHESHILECRSVEQVKWIFESGQKNKKSQEDSLHDNLPFKISSRLQKCPLDKNNNNSSSGSLKYYFVSTLDTRQDNGLVHPGHENEEWSMTVTCGYFGPHSTIDSINHLPTITATKPYKRVLKFDDRTITLSKNNSSRPASPVLQCGDLVLANMDQGASQICACQLTNGSLTPAEFLNCHNLDECQLKMSMDEKIGENACPGILRQECSSFLTHQNFKDSQSPSSGLLFCPDFDLIGSLSFRRRYVPFISTDFLETRAPQELVKNESSANNLVKQIDTIGNNASEYGKWLQISYLSDDHSGRISTQNLPVQLQCSGSSFIFLKDFQWNVHVDGDATNDHHHLSLTETTSQETDDMIVSKITISTTRLTQNINLTVVCGAAVRNSNKLVQSKKMPMKIEARRPEITKNVSWPLGRLVRYRCVSGPNFTISWMNYSSSSCMVDGEDLLCKNCQKSELICTAIPGDQNGAPSSESFGPSECTDKKICDDNTSSALKDEKVEDGATKGGDGVKLEDVTFKNRRRTCNCLGGRQDKADSRQFQANYKIIYGLSKSTSKSFLELLYRIGFQIFKSTRFCMRFR